MVIKFSCQQCGTSVSVADQMAGRQGRCRNCRQIMRIPADSGTAVRAAATRVPDAVTCQHLAAMAAAGQSAPSPAASAMPSQSSPPAVPAAATVPPPAPAWADDGGGWFVSTQNGQAGPLSTDAVAARILRGEIPAATPVWRNGMPEWQPAAALPQFAPRPVTAPRHVQPVRPVVDDWRKVRSARTDCMAMFVTLVASVVLFIPVGLFLRHSTNEVLVTAIGTFWGLGDIALFVYAIVFLARRVASRPGLSAPVRTLGQIGAIGWVVGGIVKLFIFIVLMAGAVRSL